MITFHTTEDIKAKDITDVPEKFVRFSDCEGFMIHNANGKYFVHNSTAFPHNDRYGDTVKVCNTIVEVREAINSVW